MADACVGKSLNKNKFVYVLGQGAQKEDKTRHEPTLPSAAEPRPLSQCCRAARDGAIPVFPAGRGDLRVALKLGEEAD